MITLGHEWGRDHIGQDLWTKLWKRRVLRILEEGGDVVVDDCRYPNEAALVEELGGTVIRIIRHAIGEPIDHVSERGVRANVNIHNDGPIEVLHHRLDGMIRLLENAA
jgi:hypothetical protein